MNEIFATENEPFFVTVVFKHHYRRIGKIYMKFGVDVTYLTLWYRLTYKTHKKARNGIVVIGC